MGEAMDAGGLLLPLVQHRRIDVAPDAGEQPEVFRPAAHHRFEIFQIAANQRLPQASRGSSASGSGNRAQNACSRFMVALEHDPEKWKPVFGQDHAQTKFTRHDRIQLSRIMSS